MHRRFLEKFCFVKPARALGGTQLEAQRWDEAERIEWEGKGAKRDEEQEQNNKSAYNSCISNTIFLSSPCVCLRSSPKDSICFIFSCSVSTLRENMILYICTHTQRYTYRYSIAFIYLVIDYKNGNPTFSVLKMAQSHLFLN